MIEPVRSGAALLDEVRDTVAEPGSLSVWWLGQSGYLIKSRFGTLVVDPYLSEHLTKKYEGTNKPHIRMTRAPVRGGELGGVDLVLSTHKHSDHLDPGTIGDLLDLNGQAPLVLPASLIEHAAGMGIAGHRLTGLVSGQTIEKSGFSIRALPSAHEGLDRDAEGRHLYLGYVIETDGFRLYHSGDTVVYEGLEAELGSALFDVLFLPVNGRDPARGVAGNMSVAEAVDLASVMRPRFVVPHHYDMFTFNTVPIHEFVSESARLPEGVAPRVLQCGERWEIKR